MSGLCLVAALCVWLLSPVGAEISCRNEAGEAVDWFAVYKLPMYKIYKPAGSGLEYLYLDSTLQEKLSRFLINTNKSEVGQVLQQLYQVYNKSDTVYMMYNDDPPGMKNFTFKRGHSKGTLLFDKSQGFWLIHSVPHFPPFPEDGFGYPATGRLYGQTAICVTYKYRQFQEIATQLLYYNPNVYNCSIPEPYREELWQMQTICQGSRFPWVNSTRQTSLKSAQGEPFLSFAKSKYFIDDIFAGWMAQKLGVDLLSETWQPRGEGLPLNCSLQHHVYNIKRITLPDRSSFYSHEDHSKWCVAKLQTQLWTCIGDLNRNPGQMWRSGGFICTQNKLIYSSFSNMVSYYQNCTHV
ncbi:LOW QUALITY PROTEIN: deoxyribonuclease-2-beta [Pelodytes ibericus]